MSDGNTQEPVAWAVIEADGTRISVHDNARHAAIVIEELAYDGMEAVPLYRSPLLTDDEREAIERLAIHCADTSCVDTAKTLWGLLGRIDRRY
jgi:hypothetical protein